jgi:hypothetical protein
MRDRGQYVADAIMRAYIEAGKPGKLPKLASFDAWSDSIRSALVWLGCADPCDTMERMRDALLHGSAICLPRLERIEGMCLPDLAFDRAVQDQCRSP